MSRINTKTLEHVAYITIASMLFLTACGSVPYQAQDDTHTAAATQTTLHAPEQTTETQTPTITPEQTTEAQTPTITPERLKTIYFIDNYIGNNAPLMVWAVLDAARDLGCKAICPHPEDSRRDAAQMLNEVASLGADAIIIDPFDSSLLAEPISEIYRSGLPIVIIDIADTASALEYSARILIDSVQAGRMAAEEMLRLLKEMGTPEDEDAHVAIQVGSLTARRIKDRLQGFNEHWNANAPEKWIVLNNEIRVNDGDINKAIEISKDFLDKDEYPNLVAMFTPNNGSTIGTAIAIAETARKEIAMVGFELSWEISDLIMSDQSNASTIAQRDYTMGYESLRVALELANGGTIAEKDIYIGSIVINKANLNSDEIVSREF